ncbi:hypothetical protein EYF80_038029 [Liparis tanakae]|uniref:Uncharacterized protein n=1 Tax=Liparis tanakae TaxID=230148 RepID=A0A4Z2GDX0_9TELE|nr:hypothetical protein EYF80_038029 [Liparis tanakae]
MSWSVVERRGASWNVVKRRGASWFGTFGFPVHQKATSGVRASEPNHTVGVQGEKRRAPMLFEET